MHLYLNEIDDIYFKKTRSYFREVISSYENDNYRSAIVMLYSVVICDILFKLQELSEVYNDKSAQRILSDIEKTRNQPERTKWETELIDKIYKETELIDDELYMNLSHLKDYRNYSAHPALNGNFELVTPTKEITIGLIRIVLENLLVRPPIFIKKVVDMMVDDLEERNVLYIDDMAKLKAFLDKKYYDKMPMSMKEATIKALWKLTFKLADDDHCVANRKINRMALQILCEEILTDVVKFIESTPERFDVAVDDECVWQLILMLSELPELFVPLQESVKDQLIGVSSSNGRAKSMAWFITGDLRDHCEVLTSVSFDNRDTEIIDEVNAMYSKVGLKKEVNDVWVSLFGKSSTYDTANFRFRYMIAPILKELSEKQLCDLLEHIESNDQIYDRRTHSHACSEIYDVIVERFGDTFDFSQYKRFVKPIREVEHDDIPF